jgi:hypothetical protein
LTSLPQQLHRDIASILEGKGNEHGANQAFFESPEWCFKLGGFAAQLEMETRLWQIRWEDTRKAAEENVQLIGERITDLETDILSLKDQNAALNLGIEEAENGFLLVRELTSQVSSMKEENLERLAKGLEDARSEIASLRNENESLKTADRQKRFLDDY